MHFNQEIFEKEERFYTKEFNFSYSSLNKLLYSPRKFHKEYILGEREELIEAYLIEGKVIHALLLEDGSFDDTFILSPSKIPNYGTGERIVIDTLFARLKPTFTEDVIYNLDQFQNEILEILKDIPLHQKLKTDAQRIEKIVTEGNISYFEFLQTKKDKTLIDSELLDKCTRLVEEVKKNEVICNLLALGRGNTDTFAVYNELPLTASLELYPFGIKGVIDNLVVDVEAKKVYINDIKTTSKSLMDFKESVDYYNYWLQAGMYNKLIANFLSEVIDPSWIIEIRFIVIDKYGGVYPFKVSEQTMTDWYIATEDVLNRAKWHYTERNFDLPMELAKGEINL